jgi:hypothetical protein
VSLDIGPFHISLKEVVPRKDAPRKRKCINVNIPDTDDPDHKRYKGW